MEHDVVPNLLESIQFEFDRVMLESPKIKKVLVLLKNGKATYLDVNEFAIEVGEILAKVLNTKITVDVLPDGKMYFNIADRILNATMQKNYDLISNFAVDVQTELNHLAGFKIKGQAPVLNQDRIDGIVNRISGDEEFNSIKWILNEPIVNFSQSIVDDSIKTNAEFHSKAGLKPEITRRVSGHACDWCQSLAGTYQYHKAPDDIYRRHERCRCTVDYKPGDGRNQDVWSKEWRDPERDRKIAERKMLNITERMW